VAAITEAEILLQLEKVDAERVQNSIPSIHSVSPVLVMEDSVCNTQCSAALERLRHTLIVNS
jgi:hypothetical protein